VLKQDIQDNKPLVDRLNKSGLALGKLGLSPADADLLQETMQEDNRRVDDIRRAVRERSLSIDEALQQSAEVSRCTQLTSCMFNINVAILRLICRSSKSSNDRLHDHPNLILNMTH